MRRTGALTSTLVLLILLAFGPSSIPAQGSEAHLIGEWVGTWTGTLYQGTGLPAAPTPRGIKNNGDYYLTITKAGDGQVYGRVQQPGLTPSEIKFVGTLNQNVLSFGNDRYRTELTIDGERMNGTRLGGSVPWQIALQKKK